MDNRACGPWPSKLVCFTAGRWQDYFAEAGVDGLIKDRSKPPGRKPLSTAMKLKVVQKTVKERPASATHWSVRLMAEEMSRGSGRPTISGLAILHSSRY